MNSVQKPNFLLSLHPPALRLPRPGVSHARVSSFMIVSKSREATWPIEPQPPAALAPARRGPLASGLLPRLWNGNQARSGRFTDRQEAEGFEGGDRLFSRGR